jgi:hypothetical protein
LERESIEHQGSLNNTLTTTNRSNWNINQPGTIRRHSLLTFSKKKGGILVSRASGSKYSRSPVKLSGICNYTISAGDYPMTSCFKNLIKYSS